MNTEEGAVEGGPERTSSSARTTEDLIRYEGEGAGNWKRHGVGPLGMRRGIRGEGSQNIA